MFATPSILLLLVAVAPFLAAAAPSCDRPDSRDPGPVLPETGTDNELPSPPPNSSLKHIALGFGIQNYTCARPGDPAAATGALAMLYDITHLYPDQGSSSLSPEDFANISSHALWTHRVPLNLDSSSSHALGASQTEPFPPGTPLRLGGSLPSLPFLGHHFFNSRGVPTFVLDNGHINLPTAKLDAVPAPPDADAGPEGTGAVGWLYLGPKEGAYGAKYVYRVLTAGGVSHGCSNATGGDSTSYTATYWFYD